MRVLTLREGATHFSEPVPWRGVQGFRELPARDEEAVWARVMAACAERARESA